MLCLQQSRYVYQVNWKQSLLKHLWSFPILQDVQYLSAYRIMSARINPAYTYIEKRRRTLVVPEEDHPNRLSLWCRPCRSCLRCSRTFQLHEAAIACLSPDLRPRHPTVRDHIPHRRSRADQHPAVRTKAIWCRIIDRWCRCEGTSSIRVPA